MLFTLLYDGQSIALGTGKVDLGRHPDCGLVLTGKSVSRRHAELEITEDEVWVFDLDSANGVFVNGHRIDGRRKLAAGDQLVIANHVMELRQTSPSQMMRSASLDATSPGLSDRMTIPDDDASTRHANALALLSQVAEKLFALGKTADAERLLTQNLKNILTGAREDGSIDVETCEAATREAMKLAAATTKAEWVDYVFEVYTMLGRPMAADIVDELHAVLRKVSPIDLDILRGYLEKLHANAQAMPPAEKFLLQRIEGLERLAASR